MERTYSFLWRRSISHLLGSSMSLIAVVVACVFGLLAGAVLTVAGAITAWAVVGRTVAGLVYIAVMFLYSGAAPPRCGARIDRSTPQRATRGALKATRR